MPRIIVTTDPVSSDLSDETPVLLDEQVASVHLSTSHAARQLVERLAWAVEDAESAECAQLAQPRVRPDRRTRQARVVAARPRPRSLAPGRVIAGARPRTHT